MDESLVLLTPEDEAGWREARTRREGLSCFEPPFEPKTALEGRREKAMTEPDYERQQIFQYLKEFRRKKRLKQKLERLGEKMTPEVDSACKRCGKIHGDKPRAEEP